MKTLRWLIILVSLLVVGSGVAAETVAGLPLHVQRLNPATVRVWIGDYVSSTATVAIATEKGIVVVDTEGIPKVDAQLRSVIARELKRDDFKILINTHEHPDHTGGNSVYADCTIVANELLAAGMARTIADRQRVMEWYTAREPEVKQTLSKEQAGSPAARKLQEEPGR